MDPDRITDDAAAIVHTTIPIRWGDRSAPVIADMEIARILDDIDALDDTERRHALRFLLMNLGWLAASGVYGTATALHRLAVHASRDQITHGLVEAAVEAHKLVSLPACNAMPTPTSSPTLGVGQNDERTRARRCGHRRHIADVPDQVPTDDEHDGRRHGLQ